MTAPSGKRIPTYGGHLRIQVSGELGPAGGAWEIFSYGVALSNGGAFRSDEGFLSDCTDDILAFHARPETAISGMARVRTVKVAQVLPDGKWQGGQPLYERAVDVGGGGGVTVNDSLRNAPQVALCVTLRTAINTPRTRGRMYLPLPTVVPQAATGMLGSASALQVATSAAQLVTDLNEQAGVGDDETAVVVASTFGPLTKVTNVSVGRVLDTIRSRRNSIMEAYETVPVG